MPFPTAAVPKVAVPPVKVTTSAPIALLNVRVLIIAVVVPSYSLLDAVIVGVSTLAVIVPIAPLAVVDDKL